MQYRLQQVMIYLRGLNLVKTQKDFAEKIGVTPTSLSSAINGDERYLTSSLLMRVKAKFPMINHEWILSGTGNMVITDEETDKQHPESEETVKTESPIRPKSNSVIIAQLQSEVAFLRKQIEQKDEMIKQLMTQNTKQND